MKKILILAVVISCLYATKTVVVNNSAPAVNLLSSKIKPVGSIISTETPKQAPSLKIFPAF